MSVLVTLSMNGDPKKLEEQAKSKLKGLFGR